MLTMMNTTNTPKTLLDAVKFFDDYENCHNIMVSLRWPEGVVKCPTCDSEHVTYLSNARLWKCYGKHPYEVARALGITQKSAWFMLHRVRKAMHTGTFIKLDGEVEVDETFIGGKARNMHKDKREEKITGTGGKDKTAVMGFRQRGGEVRVEVVPNRRKQTLHGMVRENVKAGAAIYSDALASYNGLEKDFRHQVVDHAIEYVHGRVHTNGLENFWSLLKRTLKGTYVAVMPFHLHRYLDEQSLRYNLRKELDDAGRFAFVLAHIVNRRLTYKQLIGENG
jgi:transposase-like protein